MCTKMGRQALSDVLLKPPLRRNGGWSTDRCCVDSVSCVGAAPVGGVKSPEACLARYHSHRKMDNNQVQEIFICTHPGCGIQAIYPDRDIIIPWVARLLTC